MAEAIAVVGLGNIGLAVAAVMADNGINVIGLMQNEKRCRLINQGINPVPEEANWESPSRSMRAKTS